MTIKKLYSIENVLPIPCLGNIVGPVRTPVRLSEKEVIVLLQSGFTLYEHNPLKTKEKVKVTMSNYNSIKFETSKKDAVDEKKVQKELIIESTDKKDKKKKEETPTNDAKVETPIGMDFSK